MWAVAENNYVDAYAAQALVVQYPLNLAVFLLIVINYFIGLSQSFSLQPLKAMHQFQEKKSPGGNILHLEPLETTCRHIPEYSLLMALE